VGLGQGRHRAHMWTTDLSFDYIRINASYRS
jgi:glutamate N-acetyltransferase/amino-acid N-acetyltransferase